MAFEKEMIAAMNNPNTLLAWRRAQRYERDTRYWMRAANSWKTYAGDYCDTAERFEMNIRKGQRKLEAAQAENIAIHKDLGEAYESIRIRDERFLDDVGLYIEEAAHWRKIARIRSSSALIFSAFAIIASWGDLLTRLH